MEDRALHTSEYPDDDKPQRLVYLDPVTEGLGAHGYKARHVIHECRRTPKDGGGQLRTFPETFDRFYFESRILVDIVQDGTPEMRAEAERVKHVRFKEQWCGEHGWLYLALPESVAGDPGEVRRHIATRGALLDRAAASQPVEPLPAPRARGGIQRPKATA